MDVKTKDTKSEKDDEESEDDEEGLETEGENKDNEDGEEGIEYEENKIKVSAEYWDTLKKWLEDKGVDITEMFGGEIETEEYEGDEDEDEENEEDDEEISFPKDDFILSLNPLNELTYLGFSAIIKLRKI